MKRLGLLVAWGALAVACSSDNSVTLDMPPPGSSAVDAGDGEVVDTGVAADAVASSDGGMNPEPDPDEDAGGAADVPTTPDAADPHDADAAGPVEPDVGPDAAPEPDPTPMDRSRRRMDVVQLDRSIRVVTGGIGWTDVVGGDGPSLFDALASTLGVPDFIDRTREDLSPSLLFHKFLSDASRSVCTAWIEQESDPRTAAGTFFAADVAADATLETDLPGVFATLQRLLLRAHGHRYALDAPQLQPWANAFDEVVDATGEPWRGWRAVCIAALVHPDFYSY